MNCEGWWCREESNVTEAKNFIESIGIIPPFDRCRVFALCDRCLNKFKNIDSVKFEKNWRMISRESYVILWVMET